MLEIEPHTEISTESRTSLLLAEDEIIIALDQKNELEKYGYTVHHVPTGERAIEAALDGGLKPDLILMDIDLGRGIDGTQAAEEILRRKEIPIVFLSSHTEREIVEKTEKITSYGYVVKNSGIVVLDASIKMALKLFNAHHSLEESRVVVRKKIRAVVEPEPENDLGALELTDIIDTDELQSVLEDFHHITGMLSAILDTEGNILVGVGWQDICTRFHRVNPESAKHCVESDTILADGVKPGEFKAYRCRNNMWDMASPIVIAGRHMGNIYFGQYFYDNEEVDLEVFREQARRYGYDEENYLAALEKVPRFSREMVVTAMSFYTKLAKLISEMSYSNIKLFRTLKERNAALEAATIGEEKFRSLAGNIPDVLFITDDSGNITYLSPASKRVFGYDINEMMGRPFSNFLRDDQIPIAMEQFRDTVFSGSNTSNFSLIALRADKTELPIEINASILTRNDLVAGSIGSIRDISDRREAEEELNRQLREKEVLLREVHHRMKNNMNSIESRLSMQIDSTVNEEARKIISTTRGRLESIRQVYDKLTNQDQYKSMSARNYIEDLAGSILEIFPGKDKVSLHTEITDISLDMKTLFSLGTIINELLTNAMKYAFRDRDTGYIKIFLVENDGELSLVIRDNGIGLPSDFDPENPKGLGTMLVKILAEQLGGSLHMENKEGTRSEVRFSPSS